MKNTLLIAGFTLVVCLVISTVIINRANRKSEALENKAALVCRAIGDQLLHHAGDTRSRVLPVKQLGNEVFQLEFQHSFTFIPDTLVKVVQSNVATHGLPKNYTVNVYQCQQPEVFYGFQINPDQKDIVPCLGREQASGCYRVQIAFADLSAPLLGDAESYVLLASMLAAILFAICAWYYLEHSKGLAGKTANQTIHIGNCQLHFDRQTISNGLGTVELSKIEAKLLTILAKEQNQLVTRERLLKEVWEDEGVFTSRSLDMFISKLRKKFKQEDSVRLTNIYGKGYKLEVG